ncbi:MAG: hypothetical protein SNJ72_01015 [Fimbriimonadales bacterium]
MYAIALQFGAGKIGRGFFAQLYTRSGLEVLFVEARPDLVESLNRHRACWIEWTDGTRETVAPVSAITPDDTVSLREAFRRAQVASTAVGVNLLPHLAAPILEGLRARQAAGLPPLVLLLGENDVQADQILAQALHTAVPPEEASLLNHLNLVRTIIGRQVVAELPGDPPGVRADRYSKLPVDADAIREPLPPIEGLYAVRPFEAYVQRKLYVHNGLHALIAYLGAAKGYSTIQEALADPEIHTLYRRGAEALERAFLKAFPFDPQEHHETIQDILARIEDPHLNDPIARVAYEPLRKLRPHDRLVGAYRLLVQQGEDAEPFWQAIHSALHYSDPNDPESVRLSQWVQESGEHSVLQEWCQLTQAHHS